MANLDVSTMPITVVSSLTVSIRTEWKDERKI